MEAELKNLADLIMLTARAMAEDKAWQIITANETVTNGTVGKAEEKLMGGSRAGNGAEINYDSSNHHPIMI